MEQCRNQCDLIERMRAAEATSGPTDEHLAQCDLFERGSAADAEAKRPAAFPWLLAAPGKTDLMLLDYNTLCWRCCCFVRSRSPPSDHGIATKPCTMYSKTLICFHINEG